MPTIKASRVAGAGDRELSARLRHATAIVEASSGPSLEQYIETRLNLLNERIDEKDAATRERIAGLENVRDEMARSFAERFSHGDKVNQLTQEASKRAVDKAEEQQQAINIASNEWRATLNDFKLTTVNRAEFDRLAADFAAYRLEASRLISLEVGAKQGVKETRDDSKATWAIIATLAAALVSAVVSFVVKHA